MLKQSKRIGSRTVVKDIMEEGTKTVSPLFVFFKKETALPENRYAVVIGKKIAPSAVKRNAVRRKIYEAIRIQEKESPRQDTKSYDTVILARTACLKASFERLASTLLKSI